MNKFKDRISVGVFQLLALFSIRMLRIIGRLLGYVIWLINGSSRKVTEENLKICYPDMPAGERKALAKRSIQHLAITGLELGPAWNWSAERILQKVIAVEGMELFEEAEAKSQGILFLAPHLGNWEVLGIFLGKHCGTTSMFQPPDNPALNTMIASARARSGATLVPTSTRGVKAVLQVLKRGGVSSILPDQVPPKGSGEFALFYNEPALTMTLIYNLVRRTNAQVLMGFAMREESGNGFTIKFKKVPDGIYSDDIVESLNTMNKSIEECVAQCPEQYQWEYKRFKKQPDGKKKYYRKN